LTSLKLLVIFIVVVEVAFRCRISSHVHEEEGVVAGRMIPPEAASSDSTEHLT
jgi:hypothetical protein